MLALLTRFAALSLISGMVMALLPEGSVRRTASMAVGLMMLLFWVQGISEALSTLPLLQLGEASPLLTETGMALTDAEAAAQALFTPTEAEP